VTKSFAAASAVALTLAASPALALKFDFTGGSGGDLSGTSFSKSGVSGSVSASATFGSAFVAPTDTGLGVSGFPDTDDAIDGGKKRDETLTVTFDDFVQLVSIDFGSVDDEDDWDVLVDGVLFEPGGDESTENPFTFGGSPILVKSFSVRSDDFFECTETGFLGICTGGGPDDVTVAGFTVVPLPGALPLIATGAVFFGWAARRKRAA